MKYSLLSLFMFLSLQIWAQLPANSIAGNFTAKDINGNTWSLYDILDQGKSVIIDFSTTWCQPCWEYHSTHNLRTLYEEHGPNGTNELMVLFVECDPNTNKADLQGTGSSTQGNWIADTPYPIIDTAAMNQAYSIHYIPTIYLVCPDKKINEVGPLSASELFAKVQACAATKTQNIEGLVNLSISPNPTAAYINVQFSINTPREMKITLTDMSGRTKIVRENQRYSAGSNSLHIEIKDLAEGVYFLHFDEGGRSTVREVMIHR